MKNSCKQKNIFSHRRFLTFEGFPAKDCECGDFIHFFQRNEVECSLGERSGKVKMLCYRCHHIQMLKPRSILKNFVKRERKTGSERGGWKHLARSYLKLKPYNTRFTPPTSRLSKRDRICDSGIAFSRGASLEIEKGDGSSRVHA